MASKRFHWTTKPDYQAQCQDCGWEQNSRAALGQAAQHHDRTGHSVRVGVESAVYYETRERYEAREGRPR